MFSQLNLLPLVRGINDRFEESYTGDSAREEIETNADELEVVDFMSRIERFVTGLSSALRVPEEASRAAEPVGSG